MNPGEILIVIGAIFVVAVFVATIIGIERRQDF